MAINYEINKGINRSIEFRGLKAQYIYYLGIGMAVLLVGFSIMYIAGVPVYLCVPVVLFSGLGLFMVVYRYSHRYGEHGLMKAIAFRQVPSAIVSRSGNAVRKLSAEYRKIKSDDSNYDYRRGAAGGSASAK